MMDFQNIEFFREGYGLLPDLRDKDTGTALGFPRTPGGQVLTGYCNCRESRKTKSCRHFSLLVGLAAKLKTHNNGKTPTEALTASVWSRLTTIISDGDPVSCENTQVREATGSSRQRLPLYTCEWRPARPPARPFGHIAPVRGPYRQDSSKPRERHARRPASAACLRPEHRRRTDPEPGGNAYTQAGGRTILLGPPRVSRLS